MSRSVMFTGTVTDRFPRVSGDEPHDGYQVEHAG